MTLKKIELQARHDNLDFTSQAPSRCLAKIFLKASCLSRFKIQPLGPWGQHLVALKKLKRGKMDGIARQLLQSSSNASTVSFAEPVQYYCHCIFVEEYKRHAILWTIVWLT